MAEAVLTLAWIDAQGAAHGREVVLAEDGETVAALLARPEVRRLLPLPIDQFGLALFGRAVDLQQCLAAGDRLELLPPLRIDPKLARQRRVEVARAARAGGRLAREASRRARREL